jgi:hypothetical protein
VDLSSNATVMFSNYSTDTQNYMINIDLITPQIVPCLNTTEGYYDDKKKRFSGYRTPRLTSNINKKK